MTLPPIVSHAAGAMLVAAGTTGALTAVRKLGR